MNENFSPEVQAAIAALGGGNPGGMETSFPPTLYCGYEDYVLSHLDLRSGDCTIGYHRASNPKDYIRLNSAWHDGENERPAFFAPQQKFLLFPPESPLFWYPAVEKNGRVLPAMIERDVFDGRGLGLGRFKWSCRNRFELDFLAPGTQVDRRQVEEETQKAAAAAVNLFQGFACAVDTAAFPWSFIPELERSLNLGCRRQESPSAEILPPHLVTIKSP